MTVEVFFGAGCPNAAATLALVRRCIDQLGLPVRLASREGDYASPTVRVNGVDVMGGVPIVRPACRLDLPTEERVLAALREARR